MEDEGEPEELLNQQERRQIIEMYALRICNVYEAYITSLNKIFSRVRMHSITPEEAEAELLTTAKKTNHSISKLLIEQFYNTGEDDIFDRAMKFDENIELEPYTVIPETETEPAGCDDEEILTLYHGLFILFTRDGDPRPARKIKIIMRDPDLVTKINKKLARGRQFLTIDEYSLGHKEYDGLCQRTHYH